MALSERRRSFWRAIGLTGLVAFLSPLNSSPFGPLLLVGVPTAITLVAFHWNQPSSMVFALALIAFAGVGLGNPTEMWFIERGWAVLLGGGFAVATVVGPRRPLFERSVLGVLVAGAAVGVAGGIRPDLLASLDWQITGQFDRTLSMFDLEGQTGAAVAEAMRQVAEVAKVGYPALLVLGSTAALACASYLEGRMEGVEAPLGPMRQFRFSDHLAWVLVIGIALLVLPVGVWAVRAGGNLVAVMGGLYVFRGVAVLVWLGTSVISSSWSIALWVVAALLFYPITIGTAFVMGLSDTWLDLRSRLRVETEGE